MALPHYTRSSFELLYGPSSKTEFEILKESHRFLREDTDKNDDSWNEQLAAKYYSSLYREFAVCDLKHYKSGNFALRWRSEDEVLSGAGESTCGNIRCEFHNLPEHLQSRGPSLTTLELPFAYEEHSESKSALVKVVLCPKCLKKLMWKRRKQKEARQTQGEQAEEGSKVKGAQEDVEIQGTSHRSHPGRPPKEDREGSSEESQDRGHRPERHCQDIPDAKEQRRRSSRSRSPKPRRRRRQNSRTKKWI